MSDTPRTDGQFSIRIDEYHRGLESYQVVRDAEFARQLERELNAANMVIEDLRNALTLAKSFMLTDDKLNRVDSDENDTTSQTRG